MLTAAAVLLLHSWLLVACLLAKVELSATTLLVASCGALLYRFLCTYILGSGTSRRVE